MTFFRILILSLFVGSAAIVAGPVANAADPQIEAAIEAGKVGERIDGYLGVVGSADPAIVRKVNEVNNKRRAVYERLAKEKGVTVVQVARITGEKQLARASAGSFIMDDSGKWARK